LHQPQITRGRIALGPSHRRAIKRKLDSLNESANGTGAVAPISGQIGNGNERSPRHPNRRVLRRWKSTGERGIDLLGEESASGIVGPENENENVGVIGYGAMVTSMVDCRFVGLLDIEVGRAVAAAHKDKGKGVRRDVALARVRHKDKVVMGVLMDCRIGLITAIGALRRGWACDRRLLPMLPFVVSSPCLTCFGYIC